LEIVKAKQLHNLTVTGSHCQTVLAIAVLSAQGRGIMGRHSHSLSPGMLHGAVRCCVAVITTAKFDLKPEWAKAPIIKPPHLSKMGADPHNSKTPFVRVPSPIIGKGQIGVRPPDAGELHPNLRAGCIAEPPDRIAVGSPSPRCRCAVHIRRKMASWKVRPEAS